MAGWLTLLYYKGVFIVSISDAVSSHPVSPGLCTHTETEKKSKEGKDGVGRVVEGRGSEEDKMGTEEEKSGREKGEVREQSEGAVI